MHNDNCNDLVNMIFSLATLEVECWEGRDDDYDVVYEAGWLPSDGPQGPSECPDDWDLPWLDYGLDFEF